MKQKIFITILSSLIGYTTLIANPISPNSVEGTVLDETGKPIQLVTVSLLNSKDSSLVKAEISDVNGKYKFGTSRQGSYLISYSKQGFEKKFSNVFTLDANVEMIMPTVTLATKITKLDEVTVTAKKPLVEVKGDKTIFNVENSINATGSDGLELLRKSPGVNVDNDENISMNGKNGVKIYIDGKMLQLDAKNVAEYLKTINSNDIEAIEMIPNPGAKYDAAGNAGVINIKMKKNKKFGTNGNASVGLVQGITPRPNAALSLNYRDKKISVFSNVSGSLGQSRNQMNLERFLNDSVYDMRSTMLNRRRSGNIKAGLDYTIDKKNTIGVMMNVSRSKNEWSNNAKTEIYNEATGVTEKYLIATNAVPRNNTNANFNANWRHVNTKGMELNVDADYGIYKGRANSFQPNRYEDTDGNELASFTYKNNTPVDINIYSIKADVESKLGKGKIGYGAKFSYVKTKNTFDFFNVINGNDSKVLDKSNSFTYKENINAAYVNYQQQVNKKLFIQGGLRLEQTNSNGVLTRADGVFQTDNNVERSYLNAFPSAAFNYMINKNNSINLTYSRRIDRPTYQDLNPFENKLDELTYEKGNAFLQPQYTDNIELKHIFKSMFTTSISYSYVRDYATQVFDTTNKNASFVQKKNLATQEIVTARLSTPTPINKWWNGYVEVWLNNMIFKGNINNEQLHITIPGYGMYASQNFKLGKDYTAEVGGWFNGPNIWGATGRTKSQGSLDVGIQKLFLQKRATIKLSATDILTTASPWRMNSDFAGLKMNGNGTWESNTFRVNLTYRFGNAQVKGARQRKAGLESESNRISSGQ